MRQKAKGTRPARNLARRAARRAVLPGYPVDPRPFTLDQADAYLTGDRLVCLLCGKPYRKLGVHLRTIHAVEPDEYRERYGLPYRDGLCGDATKARHAELSRGRLSDGNAAALAAARVAGAKARLSAYKRQMGQRTGLARHGLVRPWSEGDFREFVRRMLVGRPVADVARDPDMPGQTQFYRWRRASPDFAAWMADEIEAAPFAIQAKLGRLGRRFDEEAGKLRAVGMFYRDIAKRLGVTPMTVFHHSAPPE